MKASGCMDRWIRESTRCKRNLLPVNSDLFKHGVSLFLGNTAVAKAIGRHAAMCIEKSLCTQYKKSLNSA